MMSFNLLADSLAGARLGKKTKKSFDDVPIEFLQWNHRRKMIFDEICKYKPDVICLQELDRFEWLESKLGQLQYVGIFKPKEWAPSKRMKRSESEFFTTLADDGVALFWNRAKFEYVEHKTLQQERTKNRIRIALQKSIHGLEWKQSNDYDENRAQRDRDLTILEEEKFDLLCDNKEKIVNLVKLRQIIEEYYYGSDQKSKNSELPDICEHLNKVFWNNTPVMTAGAQLPSVGRKGDELTLKKLIDWLKKGQSPPAVIVKLALSNTQKEQYPNFADQNIVVTASHLDSEKKITGELIRTEEAETLLQEIRTFANGGASSSSSPSSIFIGIDMNGTSTNQIGYDPLAYTLLTKQEDLLSAYSIAFGGEEPPYSTWKQRSGKVYQHTIDYIFFDHQDWNVNSVLDSLPKPIEDFIRTNKDTSPLPGRFYPSDHLAIFAQFSYHPKSKNIFMSGNRPKMASMSSTSKILFQSSGGQSQKTMISEDSQDQSSEVSSVSDMSKFLGQSSGSQSSQRSSVSEGVSKLFNTVSGSVSKLLRQNSGDQQQQPKGS